MKKPNLNFLSWEKWWGAYEDDSIRARAGSTFDVDLSATKWKQIPGCWGKYVLFAGEKMSKQERDAFKNTSKTIEPQMYILGGL